MKKILTGLFLILSLSFFLSFDSYAQTSDSITASATLLDGIGHATISKVVETRSGGIVTSRVFSSAGDLSFGPLTEPPDPSPSGLKLGIFLPAHFFAVDLAYSGGGIPDSASVTPSFAIGDDPAGDGGLGIRATATFTEIAFNTAFDFDLPISDANIPSLEELPFQKVLLRDIATASLPLFQDIEVSVSGAGSGGWLRSYIGIVSLDPTAVIPDDTLPDVTPFTTATPAGDYRATVTFTFT